MGRIAAAVAIVAVAVFATAAQAAPTLTLSPTHGLAGSSVTATGRGYDSGPISVGQSQVGTYSADWSQTFTIPTGQAAGDVTVTAGAGSATFTVDQPPVTSALVELDPANASRVHVRAVPQGTAKLHWAVMKDPNGTGIQYQNTVYDPQGPYFTPPADHPVVDAEALSSTGAELGSWYSSTPGGSRIVTTPPAPPSGMVVGLDYGNYGSGGAQDVRGAVGTARFDTDLGSAAFSTAKATGLKFDVLFGGPFSTNGVCGISPGPWVSSTLSWYTANTDPAQSPYVEVLNEPGGTWFWGSNATSSSNGSCYRTLLQQTYTAFHNQYGQFAPKVLAAVDGSAGLTFGQNWWQAASASYVDGVTVHPYGGTGDRASSALGNRQRVSDAHTLTGEPVYITEVGWPTAAGQPATGDSLQWSEADQATNLTNFMNWARSTGIVPLVTYFNYHDYGSNNWYGVVRSDGSHKPSYDALKAAAGQ